MLKATLAAAAVATALHAPADALAQTPPAEPAARNEADAKNAAEAKKAAEAKSAAEANKAQASPAAQANRAAQARSPAEARKEGEVKKGEKITVTASPLGRGENEMAQPATVLTEEDLRRKRAASLGDTLGQEPGVHSSAFGPGSGRPIIRGLDGARIRVLENGIGTMDASSVSPDHMVATESLHADQVEILRGPASLLYGSGAIGGIVNVVSNLIPRHPADSPFGGNVETRFSSGNRERTGSATLEGGSESVAWHLDGFRRKTENYRIPGDAVRRQGDERSESPSGHLPDSFVDAKGAGAGASWVGGRGYFGGGLETLRNVYGIPNGEGSHIALRQTRYETSGELADPLRGLTRLRFRVGFNDYRHEEIDAAGHVGTTFTNRANESRIELNHGALAGVTGTVGAQFQDRKLAALGEEALIPETRTRAAGIFIVEQKELGAFTADAGVRFERETRRPQVSAENAEKFAGAIDRDFTLVTPALGLVWTFAPAYRLAVSATQAQRAPATEELYSHGAHGATATFDIGDPRLRKEVSRNLDLSLRKVEGPLRWKVGAFATRIRDYVYGASVDADGDGVPDRTDAEGRPIAGGEFLVQRFTQADARFHGGEAELAYRPEGRNAGIRLFGDIVRARLADGSNLPRIAPARIGISHDAREDRWSSSVSAIHGFAQKRTAALETPTPGYTRLDAEIAYQLESGAGLRLLVFLQGSNLLDREIRLHTSYLKEVAPLMGRSFTLGLRGEF
jgi:iron complex outermembrane receptor protein